MARYLLLISNEGKTFYKEVLTFADRYFLHDIQSARYLGHVGVWRLTERKRSKPDRYELRTLTLKGCARMHTKRLIKERLVCMGVVSISQLKENQLQTYYNFIRPLVK